jgi:hypothetical protein
MLMKSSIIRPALAIALVAGLAACGGKASFTVGGQIQGLVYPGLVLSNAGSDLSVPANATTFAFPQQIDYGTAYNVTIKTPPAHSDCVIGLGNINGTVVGGAADTAGRLGSINIGVFCNLQSHTIGGTITGLTTDGLVLTNGSLGGSVTVAKGASTFVFAQQVTYDQTYGVTVLTQPPGQVCTVSDGVGKMGDANLATVKVSCV